MKPSEYEGNLALTKQAARNRFLAVVSAAAPGVLNDLAGAPMLIAARSAWSDPDVDVPDWRELEGSDGDPIREAILGWAQRWHLSAAWCLETAVLTLASWARNESWCEERRWFLEPDESDGFGPEDLIFQIPGSPKETHPRVEPGTFHFDPRLETRTEARARAQAIAVKLEGFIDRTLERAERVGLQTKAAARPEHFEWLVAYQVLGRTWADIRKQHGESIEYHAIFQAVHRLAVYIELPMRAADAWD